MADPFFPDGFPFTRRTEAAAPVADPDPADLMAELEDEVMSWTPAAAGPRMPAAPAPSTTTARSAASKRERRRCPRQTLVARATIRMDSHVVLPESVSTGFVSNISMQGVGFHTRKPLAIGDKYRMSIEVGPMKWSTRLRVVTCRQHDETTFDIGGEFIGNELAQRGLAA